MAFAQIIGLGRSGVAAARLLKLDGWKVTICDGSTSEKLKKSKQELEQQGINVTLGQNLTIPKESPDLKPDLIVVSPGVPWDLAALEEARNLGIETIGELELAWRYLKAYPWVGITGTNGKTTTTALVAAIFQTAGLNAPAVGNIGSAACELAIASTQSNQQSLDWVIAEISSYQIESSQDLAPKIGVWTTFTPDHLNRHKTLERYYQIKASLLQRSRQQVFNYDDACLRNHRQEWQSPYWTSIDGYNDNFGDISRGIYIEDAWIKAFGQLIMPVALFKMPGQHNLQNLLMAVAVAALAGIDKKAIAEAMTTFKGVPHRLEYICTIDGVDYINDSKATNYDAALVGLEAVKSPVILIAGGEAKEGDDKAWINCIKKKAAAVLLIGDAAETFARRLADEGYSDYHIVDTMDLAVKRAFELAKEVQGNVVLLSPACASFDQYPSFEHRGDDFRQLCLEL